MRNRRILKLIGWIYALSSVSGGFGFAQETPPEPDDPFAEELQPAEELRSWYRSGKYEEVVERAPGLLDDISDDTREPAVLLVRSLADLGRYEEALEQLQEIVELHRTAQGQLLRYNLETDLGLADAAEQTLDRLRYYQRYLFTAEDALAFGRGLVLLGLDSKQVLEGVYAEMQKREPENPACFLYAGELAMEKYDYQLAAEKFRAGLALDPKHPDLRHGLARAFFNSDRPYAMELVQAQLQDNPRHTPSLLLAAEHQLLTDQFDGAQETLNQAEKVNNHLPALWSMRSVLAHLHGDGTEEQKFRESALGGRAGDPEPDYLIGNWLGTKMRFAEGVAALRRALEIDPGHLPSRIELAQQLLRLGEEEEAWRLVEQLHDDDPYNVPIYNLLTLYDQIRGYTLERRGDFIVRMESNEMAIYGERVFELLEEAREQLHPRFGFNPSRPVLVEFFPEQQDFAIRTFGFLGGDGILGACFGYVVTMNSPGGIGARVSNWESTLWHEYCHAVTLGATRNRLPRWLSEGISVYEEGRRDPGAVRRMTPAERDRILREGGLIPLDSLNEAFVRPEQPEDLLFGYYQSGLFVDYFISEHDDEALRRVLDAIGRGEPVGQAFESVVASLDELETGFRAYAQSLAEAFSAGLDWSPAALGNDVAGSADLRTALESRPANFYIRLALVRSLLVEGQLDEALSEAESLIALNPDSPAMDPVHGAIAQIHRQRADKEREAAALWELVRRSSEDLEAMLRLLDLEGEEENWEAVRHAATRALSVNPFVTRAQWRLGEAQEALGEASAATGTFRRLLRIGADNPARVHFRIARLLKEEDPLLARRHVLDSLAASPRFRDAQRLLLELAN
ncbi:MAG TPA: tetratricopeptide repeat protein [Verrucomicrobiales bacterium]|nr:tetratricopeptide repeat protein [Verrucomicrobiales bacterium]